MRGGVGEAVSESDKLPVARVSRVGALLMKLDPESSLG